MLIPCDEVNNVLNTFRVMIILRLLLLLTNLHLKLLSTQGTGADKLLSTQRAKGRSTTLQLLNVLNDWTQSIENKHFTDCIYMDYQKAFDKVPHCRLISKLKAYHFHDTVIE